MELEEAIKITRDRIKNLRLFIPENESERKIKSETMEYLKFIKELLGQKEIENIHNNLIQGIEEGFKNYKPIEENEIKALQKLLEEE